MNPADVKIGFADINGAQIYYEEAGTGEPLVLVHAGIADRRMWDEQFPVFAERFRTIRYDMRGFGRSMMVAGEYSHYEDLRDLLLFLGVESAYFVGCSMGGGAIIDLAIAYPDMVKALIPVGSALGGYTYEGDAESEELAQALEAAEEARDIDRLNELEILLWVVGPKRKPEQVSAEVRRKALEMNRIGLEAPPGLGKYVGLTPPAAERLSEIRCPVQVMVGEVDTAQTLLVSNLLMVKLPKATKVIVPCAAHLPNMEEPSLFNTCVLKFLESVSKA